MPASDIEWREARITWEASETLSLAEVARTLNVSRQAVAQRATREGWERSVNKRDAVSRAHDKLDQRLMVNAPVDVTPPKNVRETLLESARATVREKVEKIIPVIPGTVERVQDAVPIRVDVATSDNQPAKPVNLSRTAQTLTPEDRAVVARDATVEVIATVIDRHRREWSAVRALSGEAIRERNFDRAKLAKITAETIKLIQDGERKAYGIDSEAESPAQAAKPKVVVIQRRAVAPPALPSDPQLPANGG